MIAEGFPRRDDPIWQFYRKSFTFDPLPYWTVLRAPALIVYGAADEADNVAVAESRHRLDHAFAVAGKRNYAIAVIPGVGHSLGWKHGLGLSQKVQRTILDWLAENVTYAGRDSL
jgi:pimeloyl-ACP methyl ester carboxylesterase